MQQRTKLQDNEDHMEHALTGASLENATKRMMTAHTHMMRQTRVETKTKAKAKVEVKVRMHRIQNAHRLRQEHRHRRRLSLYPKQLKRSLQTSRELGSPPMVLSLMPRYARFTCIKELVTAKAEQAANFIIRQTAAITKRAHVSLGKSADTIIPKLLLRTPTLPPMLKLSLRKSKRRGPKLSRRQSRKRSRRNQQSSRMTNRKPHCTKIILKVLRG